MFQIAHGDMFANERGLIVHGCNAHGVMGSGVAAIVRRRYPEAYERYHSQAPHYILGEIIPVKVTDALIIINAITQKDFGTDRVHANYDAIRQAMKGTLHYALNYAPTFIGCTDIHMPLIGGGLAGGDKDKIIAIMQEELQDADVLATLWLLP